jgi:hypothetical protein
MAKRDSKNKVDKVEPESRAGERDFGVPQEDQTELNYTSRNAKVSDRGNAVRRSGDDEVERDTGAGGAASGPGSSSGGDLDATESNLGTGISQSPANPDYAGGADDASNSPLGTGRQPGGKEKVGGDKRVKGSVVNKSTDNETAGKGADGTDNVVNSDEDPTTIADPENAGEDETGGQVS